MAFILSGLPLLFLAGYLERRTHKSFAETFPLTVLGTIFALYLFGLAGILRVGVYFVYAAGLAAAADLCFDLWKKKKNTGKFFTELSPGFVLALLILPAAAFFTKGRMLLNWDEFSHWSTAVKNMYLLDAFPSSPLSTCIYKSYPPSVGLLQYYFMRPEKAFTESVLYAAKDVFALSLMMPFFRNIRFQDWKRLLLTLLLVLALPLVDYYYFYRSIHVDGLMGLLIAYCLMTYFSTERRDPVSWISVSLGIFALAQIKSSGFGISLLVLLIILIDALFCRKENLPLSGKPMKGYPFTAWLMPVLMLAFAKLTWEMNLSVAGAADYWNMASALSPGNMLASIRNLQPYQQETLEKFFAALFALRDDTYAVRLSPVTWLAVPLVPACLAYLSAADRAKRKRIARLGILTVVGYGLWLIVLLVSFLFVFTDFEALNLDGFERYSSTYQLGVTVFWCFLLIETWEQDHRPKLTVFLVLLILSESMLYNGTDLMKATLVARQYNRYTQTQREDYPEPPDFSKLDPNTAKVLFIGQQSEATGLDFYYLRYLETPVYVGMIGSWSIGEPYGANDDWTKAFTLEEWRASVYESDYNYLYLYRVDDRFLADYGAAFSNKAAIQDDSLFLIRRAGGTATFLPVR